MSLNRFGFAFLFLFCLQWAGTSLCFAADLVGTGADEKCPNPGRYKDWARHFPGMTIPKSPAVSALPQGEPMPRLIYKIHGEEYDLADFLEKTKVAGFIVLHDGQIVREVYCDGYGPASRFNFQSVTKSVISILLAIMLKEHPDLSVNTKAGTIAGTLSESAYGKVPLHSILQMSSGAKFDDAKHMSGFSGFFTGLTIGRSLEAKVRSQKSIRTHGTKFQYSGIDTSALGIVIAAGTRMTNAAYLAKKLWQPLGMEASAEWKTDKTRQRTQLAFCCLYATLRDVARFGQLMAQDGVWNGKRILPEGWVYKATHSDSKHVMPGEEGTKEPVGYQYQWWTEPYTPDTFYGMGIHGQNLYVDPQADLVVVVASQLPDAEVAEFYSHTRKFMRAISRHYRSR